MRPLTLKFKGLRSYRTEQVIDFTRTNLMAVVGDTGAGKSSVLEAIYFALYGGCTWNAQSARDLIAAGGDGTLRVELTFRAKGKTWRVTRTTSATGRASTHRLECLDDTTVHDKTTEIKPIIENLVGLTGQAFLKSVVLPQGRFQELLQTSDAERAKVLKGILGLDDLESVRAQAERLHHRLKPLLDEAIHHRMQLVQNPDGVIAEATDLHADATARVGRYEMARSALTLAKQIEAQAVVDAKRHRATADKLEKRITADLTAKYAELAVVNDGLVSEAVKLDAELAAAAGRVAKHKAVLADAEQTCTGIDGTAVALNTLRWLGTELASVEVDAQELADEQEKVETAERALEARIAALSHLEERAEKSRADLKSALAHQQATEAREQYCRALLDTARQSVAAVGAATTKIEEVRARLVERDDEHVAAQESAKRAEEDLRAAEAELEAARRADAAAHAASASGPGDPCPVCARNLPEDFARPPAGAITDRKRDLTTAQDRNNKANENLGIAGANYDTARRAVAEAAKVLEEAVAERDSATASVKEALGEVDLAAPDEAILAALTDAAEDATRATGLARTAAEKSSELLVQERSDLQWAKTDLGQRKIKLQKAVGKLDHRRAKMKTEHDALPTAFRLPGELTQSRLTEVTHRAKSHQESLTDVKRDLDVAQDDVGRLHRAREGLLREVREKVEKPLALLDGNVVQLSASSAAAGEELDLAEPPPKPVDDAIEVQEHWAHQIVCAARDAVDACREEAARLEGVVVEKQSEISAALTAADVSDEEALDEALTNAKVDREDAHRRRDRALADKPLWDELSSRIDQAKPVLDSLRDVQTLLSDGQFVAAVVNRRQRTLLAVASKLLQSMTRYRFGFAADLRIVDGHTGQPREVKTLSGGETFLASLALALAMVELTARGGARVEALFLDEGFGTLDANVLGEALDTLTSQARGGRLVAVISHMRDVAVHFDDILMINATPSGSTATWLTAAERDAMIEDETRGLLV